jgi:hypothetical protein
VWFDNMRRALLTSGELERMVREDGLSGLTSNPSIFEKAIVGSTDYDEALAELRGPSAPDANSAYEGLAIADLRGAADVFRAVYDEADAREGVLPRFAGGTTAPRSRLTCTAWPHPGFRRASHRARSRRPAVPPEQGTGRSALRGRRAG